jgi:hypothetical protein
MLQQLSSEFIRIAEEAIQSKIELDTFPHISVEYYEDIIKCWDEIKNSENDKNYSYFASNAGGYISFGFYKSLNGRIYIIEAYLNIEINNIYNPVIIVNNVKNFLDKYSVSNNMP